jgi:transposase
VKSLLAYEEQAEPLVRSGINHVLMFANRRKDRVKILYWDRSGFAVWAKRLEAGVFAIPSGEPDSRRLEITAEELGALLSGINLHQATRRKRYRRSLT